MCANHRCPPFRVEEMFVIIPVFSFFKFRNIFERALTLNLSTKKMKFLFKKYVTFEEEHGTKSTVEKVREKAAQYIDQHLFDDVEE